MDRNGAIADKTYIGSYEDFEFYRLDEEAFKFCPADSVDYAVMEDTALGVVVQLDTGWSDVGSWDALWVFVKTSAS